MIPITRLTDARCILLLGAHCDDLEIGCGATIYQYLRNRPELELYWVVFASNEKRRAEAEQAARTLVGTTPLELHIERFRNGYFPFVGADLKDYFEQLKARVSPDLIFTHCLHDRHQDHRTVSELTWNTFRDHLILEYEIAKYDGDLQTPNCYVPVAEASAKAKIDILMACFESQRERAWFRPGVFEGLMNLRGVEANAPDGTAEAFYGRKLLVMPAL